MTEQQQVELNQKEKQELLTFFSQLYDQDPKMLTSFFEVISMMVRAFEGQPVEPGDVITRLTNVKNILERSRFPTYPLLAKQVYLRLIAKYAPEAYACKDWADLEAQALIEYKGQGREEYVEMTRAVSMGPEQGFFFGSAISKPEVKQSKRHFWQRKPKEEETEFEHQ